MTTQSIVGYIREAYKGGLNRPDSPIGKAYIDLVDRSMKLLQKRRGVDVDHYRYLEASRVKEGITYLEQIDSVCEILKNRISRQETATPREIVEVLSELPVPNILETIPDLDKVCLKIEEQRVLDWLIRYLRHDMSASNWNGIFLDFFEKAIFLHREVVSQPFLAIPLNPFIFDIVRNFSEYSRYYFNSFLSLFLDLPLVFFAPKGDLEDLGVGMMSGEELPYYMMGISSAMSLRFIPSLFYVGDGNSENLKGLNRISFDVRNVQFNLPVALISPIILGQVKNLMRIVEESTFVIDQEKREVVEYNKTHLAKVLRGEKLSDGISFKVVGRQLTDKFWELIVFDTGDGIVVSDLLPSVAKVCSESSFDVPPFLHEAAIRWKGERSDATAFNAFSYGTLLESLFLYGVSGRGRKNFAASSGIGLGGIGLLCGKYGDVKPGHRYPSGYYMSHIFPTSLAVSHDELLVFSNRYYADYKGVYN